MQPMNLISPIICHSERHHGLDTGDSVPGDGVPLVERGDTNKADLPTSKTKDLPVKIGVSSHLQLEEA